MRMRMHRYTSALLLIAVSVSAQSPTHTPKNLLGFNIGGEFNPSNSLAAPSAGANSTINTSSSMALELYYGRTLHSFRRTELWLDIPALVGPNHRITNGNARLPTSNATFYVTPAARLTLPTRSPITPWISVGVGYGLFETSDYFFNGAGNPTIHTHTAVVQFGAGADVRTPLKLWKPIGLRGEFRDFYALSQPTFFVPVTGGSQHGLTVSGGIFARF